MTQLIHALGPGPREAFLIEEARRLLEILDADPAHAGGALMLVLRPEQVSAVSIESGGDKAEVAGRDLESLLHGLYLLMERMGFLFLFSGERHPGPRSAKGFPELSLRHTPSVRDRGIRMNLKHVQDQSFFSEEELDGFIDSMARQRLNYLCFHMHPLQEWFPFTYQGVEGSELALGNLGRRTLPADMIGRDKVRVKEHWFPRELESITGAIELRDAVSARCRRMMARHAPGPSAWGSHSSRNPFPTSCSGACPRSQE